MTSSPGLAYPEGLAAAGDTVGSWAEEPENWAGAPGYWVGGPGYWAGAPGYWAGAPPPPVAIIMGPTGQYNGTPSLRVRDTHSKTPAHILYITRKVGGVGKIVMACAKSLRQRNTTF